MVNNDIFNIYGIYYDKVLTEARYFDPNSYSQLKSSKDVDKRTNLSRDDIHYTNFPYGDEPDNLDSLMEKSKSKVAKQLHDELKGSKWLAFDEYGDVSPAHEVISYDDIASYLTDGDILSVSIFDSTSNIENARYNKVPIKSYSNIGYSPDYKSVLYSIAKSASKYISLDDFFYYMVEYLDKNYIFSKNKNYGKRDSEIRDLISYIGERGVNPETADLIPKLNKLLLSKSQEEYNGSQSWIAKQRSAYKRLKELGENENNPEFDYSEDDASLYMMSGMYQGLETVLKNVRERLQQSFKHNRELKNKIVNLKRDKYYGYDVPEYSDDDANDYYDRQSQSRAERDEDYHASNAYHGSRDDESSRQAYHDWEKTQDERKAKKRHRNRYQSPPPPPPKRPEPPPSEKSNRGIEKNHE